MARDDLAAGLVDTLWCLIFGCVSLNPLQSTYPFSSSLIDAGPNSSNNTTTNSPSGHPFMAFHLLYILKFVWELIWGHNTLYQPQGVSPLYVPFLDCGFHCSWW
jgi:hypothetical protein